MASAEFGNLSNLTELALHNNDLNGGAIPSWTSRLSKLTGFSSGNLWGECE